MVSVPAGVGDQKAVPIDQGVVDGDDTLVAVAGGRVLLEKSQSPLIERFNVPRGVGQEAIETGLVGGPGEFVMDAEDCLAFSDDESGEVLSKVTALALVAEEVAVLSPRDSESGYAASALRSMKLATRCMG